MLWSFWIRTLRLSNSMQNQIGSALPFPKQCTTSNILKLKPLQITTDHYSLSYSSSHAPFECHSNLPWARPELGSCNYTWQIFAKGETSLEPSWLLNKHDQTLGGGNLHHWRHTSAKSFCRPIMVLVSVSLQILHAPYLHFTVLYSIFRA